MIDKYLQGYECENCAAPLDLTTAKNGVIQCPACRRKIPVPDSDCTRELLAQLSIADNELDNCEFDRAYEAYKKATEIDSGNALAYFGKALARAQIQYLKDEANDPPVMRPICHRISREMFTENADYLQAVKLAGDEQSAVLRARGREIDQIQETFYDLQKNGVDYDVFISAKISRPDGSYTDESHDASKLYSVLKDKGFKPFYSENELYKFTGSDYEAHILYALTVCTSMVLICYNESYLETPWVKNEYMRYSEMIRRGQKAKDSLVVCYKGACMDRLPHYDGKVEGIDYSGSQGMMLVLDHVKRCSDAVKAKKAKQAEIVQKTEKVQQLNEEIQLQRAANEAERLRMKQQKEKEKIDKKKQRQEEQQLRQENRQRRKESRAERSRSRGETAKKKTASLMKSIGKIIVAPFIGIGKIFSLLRKKSGDIKYAIADGASKVGHALAVPFRGIGSVIVNDETAVRLGIHITFGVLELAAFLFMISYPFSIRIVNPSPEFTAYVAVGGVLAGLILLHFAYCAANHRVDGLIMIGISVGIEGVWALICFLVGWYTNNMHDWIWVYFSIGAVIGGGIIYGCLDDALLARGNSQSYFGIAVVVTSVAAFCLLGGWLFTAQVDLNDGYSNAFYYDILDDGTLSVFVHDYDSETLEIPGEIDGRVVAVFNAPIKSGGDKLKHLIVDEGVQKLGQAAFKDCVGLEDVYMTDSVREFEAQIFEGCSSLATVRFSTKMTYVGEEMFKNCLSLVDIQLPESIYEIRVGAFEGCFKLATVKLSSSLTDIGKGAFKGCISITEISLPDMVERLGDSAFENCLNLVSVNLSQKLTYIGASCFKNCSSIESIYFPDSLTEIGGSAFSDCNMLRECHFEEGSNWYYKYTSWFKTHEEDAFSWNDDINTILSFLKRDYHLFKR